MARSRARLPLKPARSSRRSQDQQDCVTLSYSPSSAGGTHLCCSSRSGLISPLAQQIPDTGSDLGKRNDLRCNISIKVMKYLCVLVIPVIPLGSRVSPWQSVPDHVTSVTLSESSSLFAGLPALLDVCAWRSLLNSSFVSRLTDCNQLSTCNSKEVCYEMQSNSVGYL